MTTAAAVKLPYVHHQQIPASRVEQVEFALEQLIRMYDETDDDRACDVIKTLRPDLTWSQIQEFMWELSRRSVEVTLVEDGEYGVPTVEKVESAKDDYRGFLSKFAFGRTS